MLRKFKRLIKLAKVPYKSFHNLGHIHVVILMRMGEKSKVIVSGLDMPESGLHLISIPTQMKKCRGGLRIGLVNILDLTEI